MHAADVIDILTAYPFASCLSPDGRALLDAHLSPLRAGPCLVRQPGDRCDGVALLVSGGVIVRRRRPSGRELVLYTVGRGEICVLEALAVLTGAPFRGEAEAVGEVRGAMVDGVAFRALVAREEACRAFVFDAVEARLASTLELACEVALDPLETRLAAVLLRHAHAGADVRLTHDRLAQELACGREAVSRLLEAWAHRGIVRLGRGHVEVLRREALGAAVTGPGRDASPRRPGETL